MIRLGLLGHPVHHSLSPALHTRWLREAGLVGDYDALDVLPEALNRFDLHTRDGWNVTIPHKVALLPRLGRLDADALACGAVNCLWREDAGWVGGNTDGEGFLRGLEEETGEGMSGREVLILGAGGAARALGAAMVRAGAMAVWFASRDPARGSRVQELCRGAGTIELGAACLADLPGAIDLLVSTLPVGAAPLLTSFDLAALPDHATVCDINYHDPAPALLRNAAARDLQVVSGVGMFVWQAALSFGRWTGLAPDLDSGRATVLEGLAARAQPSV